MCGIFPRTHSSFQIACWHIPCILLFILWMKQGLSLHSLHALQYHCSFCPWLLLVTESPRITFSQQEMFEGKGTILLQSEAIHRRKLGQLFGDRVRASWILSLYLTETREARYILAQGLGILCILVGKGWGDIR